MMGFDQFERGGLIRGDSVMGFDERAGLIRESLIMRFGERDDMI